jgi:hypothetical protein
MSRKGGLRPFGESRRNGKNAQTAVIRRRLDELVKSTQVIAAARLGGLVCAASNGHHGEDGLVRFVPTPDSFNENGPCGLFSRNTSGTREVKR